MIYFMQAIEGGPVKIGFTDDIDRRKEQLEKHYGRRLVVLGVRPGDWSDEQAVHRQFEHLRIGRLEQFQPNVELMAFIGCPLLATQIPTEAMTPAVVSTTVPVKIDAEVMKLVKAASSLSGKTVAQYLTDIVKPIAEKDVKRLTSHLGESEK